MDKNLKEKVKSLIRKEGFYIALFLCLCILVTVGTISYKVLSNKSEVTKTEDVNKELTLNSDNEGKSINEIPNAERVENVPDASKENINKTKAEKSTIVSTTNAIKFVNHLQHQPQTNILLKATRVPRSCCCCNRSPPRQLQQPN